MCSQRATTKEHFPLKALFPKRQGLQLWTVPSCSEHNNSRARDDQYFLAQVLMNMSREGNTARDRFMESIAPQFKKSPKFRDMLASDSKDLGSGRRAYPVNVARMFNVMDGICHALIYRKYKNKLSTEEFSIWHEFYNFTSNDTKLDLHRADWLRVFEDISAENSWASSGEVADRTTEEIYSYKVFAPLDLQASVTIEHCFYGGFKVISLLTHRQVSESIKGMMHHNAEFGKVNVKSQ